MEFTFIPITRMIFPNKSNVTFTDLSQHTQYVTEVVTFSPLQSDVCQRHVFAFVLSCNVHTHCIEFIYWKCRHNVNINFSRQTYVGLENDALLWQQMTNICLIKIFKEGGWCVVNKKYLYLDVSCCLKINLLWTLSAIDKYFVRTIERTIERGRTIFFISLFLKKKMSYHEPISTLIQYIVEIDIVYITKPCIRHKRRRKENKKKRKMNDYTRTFSFTFQQSRPKLSTNFCEAFLW